MTHPATVPPPLSAERKIQRRHHERLAIVYVRQSTAHQVQRHQESTHVPYSLADHASRFGWPRERILVIDDDLGLSGASADKRHGFPRRLGELALDHVGAIFGVEMSRLARSCKDWYQLLELCSVFGTLICDLDGVYDPSCYDDRLLLGLKGTMSEAELHVLKQRMWQGSLNKARRGELFSRVPIGYVRREAGQIDLSPDEQVRATVRSVFDHYERLGTVAGVLRHLAEHGVQFPFRQHTGPGKGEGEWRRPNQSTLKNILTPPIYAGAYRAVEPGNRLVARTLESAWEEKLRESRELQERHRRFQSEQPVVLGTGEQEQIRRLAGDLPSVWHADGTTDADRKEILREVIERIPVNVEGESEWVEAKVYWVGGHQTYTRFRRPVARVDHLSTWPVLRRRVAEWVEAGLAVTTMAERLNAEGFRAPNGKAFGEPSVRTLIARAIAKPDPRDLSPDGAPLGPDEWLIPALAAELQVGHQTVYGWIRKGRIESRQLADGRWVVRAGADERRELTAFQACQGALKTGSSASLMMMPERRPDERSAH